MATGFVSLLVLLLLFCTHVHCLSLLALLRSLLLLDRFGGTQSLQASAFVACVARFAATRRTPREASAPKALTNCMWRVQLATTHTEQHTASGYIPGSDTKALKLALWDSCSRCPFWTCRHAACSKTMKSNVDKLSAALSETPYLYSHTQYFVGVAFGADETEKRADGSVNNGTQLAQSGT